MMNKVMLFVILAVVMMATQGCGSFLKDCGNAILEGAGSGSSEEESGFGLELKIAGTTYYAPARQDYAQIHPMTGSYVSISASPYAPHRMPNAGSWKAVSIRWSTGQSGTGIAIKNSQYKNYVDVTRTYAVTVTWKLYNFVDVGGGRSVEKPISDYTDTYYFQLKHVGMGK